MYIVCQWSVAQACLTLWDPTDCSLPGSSVCGILQARILELVAISYFRGSSQPKDQTYISCIGRWVLYHWSSLVIQTVKNLPAMWEQRRQKHKSVGTARKALPSLMKEDRCSWDHPFCLFSCLQHKHTAGRDILQIWKQGQGNGMLLETILSLIQCQLPEWKMAIWKNEL